ncbi:flippase [Haladaptatus caseinilyticus]|uniref:flippase n=1 Tax=Haladaptatus caseinilyticus TaxID=2993314 RepID=UPI00224A65AE|nr:flippase [Haladaptatus caseinilyticus]
MTSSSNALGNLAKSSVIILIGTIVGRLLALCSEIFIARTLNPELFGEIALTYTIVLSIGSILVIGSDEGITRMLSSNNVSSGNTIISGYVIALAGATIGSVTIYFARFLIADILSAPSFSDLIPYFLPFLLLYPLSRISFGILRAEGKSLHAVVSRELIPRIGCFIILTLFLYFNRPEEGAAIYWAFLPLFVLISSFYYVDWPTRSSLNFDKKSLHELFAFSWPLAVSSTVFLLLSNSDMIMIAYFLDSQDVGLYRAVQPLRQVTTFVMSSFTFLFLPLATRYFEENDIISLHQFYQTSTKWIVTLTFPPVLLFTFFSGDTVRVFFGSAYSAAAPTLAVLTGGLFIRSLVGLDGDVVKAINRPQIELYASVVGVVSNILLNIWLIPQFGIVGAAFGTVIGYGIYNLIEIIIIYRMTSIHPFSSHLLKPLLANILITAIISKVIGHITNFTGLISLGIVISIFQLICLVGTSSLEKDDLDLYYQIENRFGIEIPLIRAILKSGVQ